MTIDNRFALKDHLNVRSPARTPFSPLIVLSGAAIGVLLGVSVMLVVTAIGGVEWPVRLVMAFHAAASFGILGAWLAASLELDDGDDLVVIPVLPVFARIPINSALPPETPPRVAA